MVDAKNTTGNRSSDASDSFQDDAIREGASQTPSKSPVTEAFSELLKRKRILAGQSASVNAKLRAIDKALDALKEDARSSMIRIELSKNDAAMLMATCYHYAARTRELASQAKTLINGLGDFILEAIYTQDSDFARRIENWARDEHRSGPRAPHLVPPDEELPAKCPPKKDCPYLRYSDKQMEAAYASGVVGSSYDYVTGDHARLYLGRDALVEMYRRPRHTKLMYAHLMKAIDGKCGLCTRSLGGHVDADAVGSDSTRIKPYLKHSEAELRKGLRLIKLSPGQVKFAYGMMAVSFRREALLRLYRGESGHPGIACLLRIYDEKHST